MATPDDAAQVRDLVEDAAQFLDWCAGPESVIDDDGEHSPVVPVDLQAVYAAAVDQLQRTQVALALSTLEDRNDSFRMSRVLGVLADAGWDGALRDFKLQVLDRSGRAEVMEVARRGRSRGGSIRRRILKAFVGALNSALDSLDGIPGVGAIKELKDFVEKLIG
ncbi:MAG TPA: hypothetical protein VKE25_04390 [Actinomycetes bacterium]|nr:hypothetical protein [Actinomycetes bacterium]